MAGLQMQRLEGLDRKKKTPKMKLHAFNRVMLLTAPAAKYLTLMGHWGG